VSIYGGLTKAHHNGVRVSAVEKDVNEIQNRAVGVYRWSISKADTFCGITGGWGQIVPAREKPLQPTVETAHSGKYVGASAINMDRPDLMDAFTVYARSKHRQQ
jgi:hypothetical protein